MNYVNTLDNSFTSSITNKKDFKSSVFNKPKKRKSKEKEDIDMVISDYFEENVEDFELVDVDGEFLY